MASNTTEDILSEISAIKNEITNLKISQREVLTLQQAATYLNISQAYLYKLTSSSMIPFYKPQGKLCYFNRLELNDWLMQNKCLSKDEISKKANDYILNNRRKK